MVTTPPFSILNLIVNGRQQQRHEEKNTALYSRLSYNQYSQNSIKSRRQFRSMIGITILFAVLHVFLLTPSLCAAADGNNAAAWFTILDENHDEQISRDEYDHALLKLQSFMNQPLNVTRSMKSTSGSFLPWDLSSFFAKISDVSDDNDDAGGGGSGGFYKALTSSLAMILATEIGDKTFFIAAVLSMKHDRWAVFGGAIMALIVMTILSTAMGLVLPAFMPRRYTHILGGALFLYFGCRLLYDARGMEAGKASDELEEVEEELLLQSNKKRTDTSHDKLEEGGGSGNSSAASKKRQTAASSSSHAWYRVWMQSLSLTFLAEWGDRSQIATIALAAAKDPVGVTIGGCLGHCLCTGLAVLGGRMLAARISERTVSLAGGVIFILFGIHSVFFES